MRVGARTEKEPGKSLVHRDRVPPKLRGRRNRVWKRLLLLVTLAMQPIAYKVLSQARYEGQGLPTLYYRVTTMSDVMSILFLIVPVVLIVAALIRPQRISLGRTIMATIFSGLLVWLDFGVRRTNASEFEPAAAVALVISMCALLAILMTRSQPFLSPIIRVLRVVRNTILVFLLLCFYAFLYAFTFPTYVGVEEITRFNPDAGVVLGAAVWRGHGLGERPSPTLRERIEVGYDLLTKGAIPRLVVTGASAPGEMAEATVAKKDLLKRGVDESQIVEETSSHTTLEQVRYLRDELGAKQGWNRFVIISDQYHLARVCEMCKFNGLKAIGSPSRIHQPFLDLLYYRVRESVALLVYWLLGR